jgi:hypothetical protein
MNKRSLYEALFGLLFLLAGFGLGLQAYQHSIWFGWLVAVLWMGAGSWILFRTRTTVADDFSAQFYLDIQNIPTEELVMELENPLLTDVDRFRLLRYLNSQRAGWTGMAANVAQPPETTFFPD